MKKSLLERILIGLMLGISAATVVFIITELLFPTVFDNFEAQTLDQRYTLRIHKLEKARADAKIEDIIIVDIDNRSLNKLGRFHQWPRDYYAALTNKLADAGAIVIGFDILFMERDVDRATDSLFVEATDYAQNVSHALSFSEAEPDKFLYKMESPPPGLEFEKFSYQFPPPIQNIFPKSDRFDGKFIELYNASQQLGFVNFQPDNDSVIRKMPLFMNFADRLYPSLPLAMVFYLFDIQQDQIQIDPGKSVKLNITSESGSETVNLPIDQKGNLLINYYGTYQTFRYIPFYDVYANRVPAEFFQGKIVLFGATAAGLYDMRPVPFQKAFPGVEIHANILYNILNQDFITKTSALLNIIILFTLCILIGIFSSSFKMIYNIPFLLLVAAGFVFYTHHAFQNQNLWIENVQPFIGIMLSQVAVLGYKYFNELKDKRRIKGMFQNYLSPTVVSELLKKPDMLKLGGERKIATAFFSDIKNFTTFSEDLQPEELVMDLNEYLSAMTEIVLKYEGYLDKYEGDAIVAIFGIPIKQSDHALRSCKAALDMQKKLVELRKKWKSEKKPLFETRIGINSGPMIAGNIGGTDRFDYTVIGDSVNLASRLEGANKMYGTSIIISEESYRQVKNELICRELDFLRVKGKTKPVRVYELLGRKGEKFDPKSIQCLGYFAKGLKTYRKRDWIHAYDIFQKALSICPDDGPSNEFIRRCKIFIENPRPDDWDGVFELRSK